MTKSQKYPNRSNIAVFVGNSLYTHATKRTNTLP